MIVYTRLRFVSSKQAAAQVSPRAGGACRVGKPDQGWGIAAARLASNGACMLRGTNVPGLHDRILVYRSNT